MNEFRRLTCIFTEWHNFTCSPT